MLEPNVLIKYNFAGEHESFFFYCTDREGTSARGTSIKIANKKRQNRGIPRRWQTSGTTSYFVPRQDIHTHTRRFVGRTKPVSPQIHTRRFLTEVLTLAPAGELGRSFSVYQREMETEKETRRQEEEKQKEDEARERRTQQGEVKKKEEKRRRRRKRRWKNQELVKK